MMPCIFIIKNEALRFSVVFQFGDFDKSAVVTFLEEHGCDTGVVDGITDFPDDSCYGSNWRPTGYASSFVWIGKLPETREDEGTLVHELDHAICWALDQRAIRDEECKAYLLDYFYTTVMENVDAYKKQYK